jgi:hypothetical protein
MNATDGRSSILFAGYLIRTTVLRSCVLALPSGIRIIAWCPDRMITSPVVMRKVAEIPLRHADP